MGSILFPRPSPVLWPQPNLRASSNEEFGEFETDIREDPSRCRVWNVAGVRVTKIAHGELEQRLGYSFQDRGLLQLAVTHPSVAHERGLPMQTNQRLEFLGDAVLQLILTRELYAKFPELGEGPLTKGRAKLVNRRTLAEHARHLGLGSYLIVSRGEERHGGRDRPSALADTFEAILGAIFLDGGFEAATRFVLQEFQGDFTEISAWTKWPALMLVC
jgi:dsRNA-specific ribonuclease